ncbi:MAG TPA: hypothetical protein DCE41_21585 [Cytophagales bacterium]|nr:hypothetical protein [Cytophagales bacterium]HAA18324.1 hypothetical protein [Cytophagales bacterium]HAP59586.1 hypothetical protein [Cytophagales bacterium]
MRKIDALLNEYGESHQNAFNKRVHWICVPSIFFSIVGLITSIPSGLVSDLLPGLGAYANWATVGMVMALVYYLRLSFPLFLGFILWGAFCLWGNVQLAGLGFAPLWAISLTIFVAAWLGQFYGHKVEGKKPSFFKDLQFLMIGPAWLLHFIYKRAGVKY